MEVKISMLNKVEIEKRIDYLVDSLDHPCTSSQMDDLRRFHKECDKFIKNYDEDYAHSLAVYILVTLPMAGKK